MTLRQPPEHIGNRPLRTGNRQDDFRPWITKPSELLPPELSREPSNKLNPLSTDLCFWSPQLQLQIVDPTIDFHARRTKQLWRWEEVWRCDNPTEGMGNQPRAEIKVGEKEIERRRSSPNKKNQIVVER